MQLKSSDPFGIKYLGGDVTETKIKEYKPNILQADNSNPQGGGIIDSELNQIK